MAYLQRAFAPLLCFALCFASRSSSVVINDAAHPQSSRISVVINMPHNLNPQVWTSRETGCPGGSSVGINDAAQPQSAGSSVVIKDAAQPRSPDSSVVINMPHNLNPQVWTSKEIGCPGGSSVAINAAQPQSAGSSVVIKDAAQPQAARSSVVINHAAQPQSAGLDFRRNWMPWG